MNVILRIFLTNSPDFSIFIDMKMNERTKERTVVVLLQKYLINQTYLQIVLNGIGKENREITNKKI